MRGIIDIVVACPEVNRIDIQLEQGLFVAEIFQLLRDKDLRNLARELLFLRKIHVLGKLLRDRTAPFNQAPGFDIMPHRASGRENIKAMVAKEPPILRCDHRLDIPLRQRIVGCIMCLRLDRRDLLADRNRRDSFLI